MTVAALHAAARQPDALVLILAADHVVGDDAAFLDAVRAASLGAKAGRIMTLASSRPRPHRLWLHPARRAPARRRRRGGARVVERFLEKPNAARAERLIGEGALWNSGYFLFRPT